VALAKTIQDSFPPLDALKNYAKPVTSWSAEDTPAPDAASWTACFPDLGQMTKLCERLFSWGTSTGIKQKLSKHVWPGIHLHRMLRVCQS